MKSTDTAKSVNVLGMKKERSLLGEQEAMTRRHKCWKQTQLSVKSISQLTLFLTRMPRLQRKSQINTEDKMDLGAELTDLNGAYLNSI